MTFIFIADQLLFWSGLDRVGEWNDVWTMIYAQFESDFSSENLRFWWQPKEIQGTTKAYKDKDDGKDVQKELSFRLQIILIKTLITKDIKGWTM